MASVPQNEPSMSEPTLSLLHQQTHSELVGFVGHDALSGTLRRPSGPITTRRPWTSTSNLPLMVRSHTSNDAALHANRKGSVASLLQQDTPLLSYALDYVSERCILSNVLEVPSPVSNQNIKFVGRTSPAGKRSWHRSVSSIASFVLPTLPSDGSLAPSHRCFMLAADGCVLQYNLHGTSQRNPERILLLGPTSTATASDAIPGKHWVLRITHDRHSATSKPSSGLKNLQSKLRLRNMVSDAASEDMLLIFDNAKLFNNWLITVRREIATKGGMSYCPDFRETYEEVRPQTSFAKTHATQSPGQLSLDSVQSSFVGRPHPHSQTDPTSGQCLTPESLSPQAQWSSHRAASSIGTTISLDVLRESEGGDETPHHMDDESSCTTSSYVGQSMTPDIARGDCSNGTTFTLPQNSTSDLMDRRKKMVPFPITVQPATHQRSASCHPAIPSPSFPRTPTLPVEMFAANVGEFDYNGDEIRWSREPVSASKMAQWLNTISTQREQARAMSDNRFSSTDSPQTTAAETAALFTPLEDTTHGPQSFKAMAPQPETVSDSRPMHPPTQDPPSKSYPKLPPTPICQDAPQRTSCILLDKHVSLDPADLLSEPADSQSAAYSPTLDAFPMPGTLTPGSRSSSYRSMAARVEFKKPASIQIHKNIEAFHAYQDAERSPAVTDFHLITNFGIESPYSKEVALAETKGPNSPSAPAFRRSSSSDHLRESNRLVPDPLRKPSTYKKQHVKHQRSMPNLLYRADRPLSPAPSDPLPAVPLLAPHKHTRGRSFSPATRLGPLSQEAKHSAHGRSATVDLLASHPVSHSSSNSASSADINHARGFSPNPIAPGSKHTSRQRSRDSSRLAPDTRPSSRSSIVNAALANIATSLQRIATPATTPSFRPATPKLVRATSAPEVRPHTALIGSIDKMLHADADGLTALPPLQRGSDRFPFPVVVDAV